MKTILIIFSILLFTGIINGLRNHDSSLNKGLKHRIPGYDSNPSNNRRVNPNDPPVQWFTNRVDHYDPQNSNTFKQKFYVNDTYYTPGSPVFYILGGEGPVGASYVTGHFVFNQYAQKFNALLVAIEHRFYGDSIPMGSLSLENLKFLTTQQALADYAAFVPFLSQKYNTGSSKWISFGGSYSGNLSGWLRLKYPQLISAAIATSAPVKAQLDFPEYFEVISQSIGPTCSAIVSNITQTVTTMLNNGQNDLVQQMFSACDPIVSDLDIATFMESLSSGITETVQYNLDNNNYTFTNITAMCERFEQSSDPMKEFIDFNNEYNQFSGSQCTLSSYKKSVEYLQSSNYKSVNASSRSWNWQCCTEYGYWQTGSSQNQPFSSAITLEYFTQMCTDIFGPKGFVYQPAIQYILNDYGGTNIQATNVIYERGTIDPWSVLSVQSPPNSESQVFLIDGAAHCAPMYPSRPNDLPGVIEAREMEISLISSIVFNN
ncbi:hypothetical protein ACTA71_006316 [Dictyostelium dimigraforme]